VRRRSPAPGPLVALLRQRLLPGALAAAAWLVLPAAAPAATHTLTAESGQVQATLSWTEGDYLASGVRLAIVRAGLELHDAALLDDAGAPTTNTPQRLRVRDLDGDGEPEVVADLYTNGAHCCLYSLVYRYVAETPVLYHSVTHWWGNAGYRLRDLDGDGLPEWRTGDDRFAYAFTAYAYSGFPLQVWRYQGSAFEAGFLDVTREFLALLRKDAAGWWTTYLRERAKSGADVRGILAPWLADKYLLGERSDGLQKLAAARKAGYLDGPRPWPSGRRYVAALKRFLTQLGYAG
jgi:hypothetical protein